MGGEGRTLPIEKPFRSASVCLIAIERGVQARREHLERNFGPRLLFNSPARNGHGGDTAAARGGRRWQ